MDTSIRDAVLDGLYVAYSLAFTDSLYYSALNEESTVTNVYKESLKKKYKPAVKMVGRIVLKTEDDEVTPVSKDLKLCTISIPTKELQLKEFDFTPQNLETLKKGIFTYKDVIYEIDLITPKNNIQDMFMLYEFKCIECKSEFNNYR